MAAPRGTRPAPGRNRLGFLRSTAADKPEQVARPRALTAAGQRVTVGTARIFGARRTTWQATSWRYRTCVPELRFSGSFVANQVGRVRWYAAEDRGEGKEPVRLSLEPEDPDTPPEQRSRVSERTKRVAMDGIERLNLNRRGSSMAGRLTENFEYAGEAYLLGMIDPETQTETWTIRSVSEVRVNPDGSVRLQEPGRQTEGVELNLDQVALYRLWNPDPEYHGWADAKITACLGLIEEILRYDRLKRAIVLSRIANGGLLFIPDELRMHPPGSAPRPADDVSDGDDIPVADDEDDFMDTLHAAYAASVNDEESPEALMPVIITGPATTQDGKPMKDVIGFISVDRDEMDNIVEKRAAAVHGLATGLDFPPERMEGMGAANHWNASLISDSEVSNFIEPRCEVISDSLTAAFLRHYLLQNDCPPDEVRWVCVWFDASELSQPADPWGRAKEARQMNLISDEATRKAGDYGEDAKPTDVEMLRRALVDRGMPTEQLAAAAALCDLDDETRAMVDRAIEAGTAVLVKEAEAGARTPNAPKVIDAQAPGKLLGPVPGDTRTGTTERPGSTAAPQSTSLPRVSIAASAKGPKDDPEGPAVAGVALMALDTGRVLMLQRALDDEDDPAAGTWEFPGGHIEDDDDTSLHGGMREWSEEVGRPFPRGGTVLHTWTSGNGVYQGHVVAIAHEDDLDLTAKRTVANPDDDAEQVAWIDPQKAKDYPDLRREVKRGTPWGALRSAVKRGRSPKATVAAGTGMTTGTDPTPDAAPEQPAQPSTTSSPQYRVERKLGDDLSRIDAELVTRVLAHSEASLGSALARLAKSIQNNAQRTGEGRGLFPKSGDPLTVVATAGREASLAVLAGRGVDPDAILDDALADLEKLWDHEVDAASQSVAAVLSRVTDPAVAHRPLAASALTAAGPVSGITDALRGRARRAWERLKAKLVEHAKRVLFGEREPRRGDRQGPGIIPVDLIQAAVSELGGRDDDGGPATGPGTGSLVDEVLAAAGIETLTRVWRHVPGQAAPFPAHQGLDGEKFSGWDDPALAVRPDDAWIAGGFYHPADHGGCRCGVNAVYAVPIGSHADPDGPELAALRQEVAG